MKSMLAHITCWVVALALVLSWKLKGQGFSGRLTSDASQSPHGLPMPPMPNQSGIFVPPSTLIYTEFRTSTVPLVVEITVTSNIIRRDVFWMAGRPVTNDQLLTNFLVSRITNGVAR